MNHRRQPRENARDERTAAGEGEEAKVADALVHPRRGMSAARRHAAAPLRNGEAR